MGMSGNRPVTRFLGCSRSHAGEGLLVGPLRPKLTASEIEVGSNSALVPRTFEAIEIAKCGRLSVNPDFRAARHPARSPLPQCTRLTQNSTTSSSAHLWAPSLNGASASLAMAP